MGCVVNYLTKNVAMKRLIIHFEAYVALVMVFAAFILL